MKAGQIWLADRAHQWVVFLLAVGLLIRTSIAFWLNPGFDEVYYYIYSINPNWSYFDHPPLVALTTGFGPWLTGEVSQFTIRLGELILHTGTLLLLYLTGVQLFSQRAAVLALTIATVIPIFLVGLGVLTLPDGPLMFFWSASLYVASREFFRQADYRPTPRLALIGLLVGLACLGKYHGFLLGFGLVGFCLTSSRHRSALRSPWMGLAVLLFLIALAPILIWNYQHQWISFWFQGRRGVPRGGYDLLQLLGTFLMGVGYLFPTFGFPLWWVSLKASLNQFSRAASQEQDGQLRQRLVLWVSMPAILGFTLIGGYQQVLPTWPMPGFWGMTLLLGQQATLWQTRTRRRWLYGSAIAILSLMLVALSHVAFGTLQKPGQYAVLGGFLPVEQDASTQLVDVQQLRQGFARSPDLLEALKQADFVFTNRFFLSGQVGMALYPLVPRPITCLHRDLRGFAFWSRSTDWVGKTGLYVTSALFDRDEDAWERYRPYFEQIDQVGEIPIRRGGVVVDRFFVYRAIRMTQPYPRPYGL